VVVEAEALDLVGGQEAVLGNAPQHHFVSFGEMLSQLAERTLTDSSPAQAGPD